MKAIGTLIFIFLGLLIHQTHSRDSEQSRQLSDYAPTQDQIHDGPSTPPSPGL